MRQKALIFGGKTFDRFAQDVQYPRVSLSGVQDCDADDEFGSVILPFALCSISTFSACDFPLYAFCAIKQCLLPSLESIKAVLFLLSRFCHSGYDGRVLGVAIILLAFQSTYNGHTTAFRVAEARLLVSLRETIATRAGALAPQYKT